MCALRGPRYAASPLPEKPTLKVSILLGSEAGKRVTWSLTMFGSPVPSRLRIALHRYEFRGFLRSTAEKARLGGGDREI